MLPLIKRKDVSVFGAKGKVKKNPLKSIRFRSFLYFFLLVVLALLVLWLFQLLFFKATYRSMKKQEVAKLGVKVTDKFENKVSDREYREYLDRVAYQNGVSILIFNFVGESGCPAEDCTLKVKFVSGQFTSEDEGWGENFPLINPAQFISGWNEYYDLIAKSDKISYEKSEKQGNYYIYGAKLDENSYLYLAASTVAKDGTVLILRDQLILATVLCLLLSLLASFFISRQITKPISRMSRAARKLGEGDYGVRFNGSGYNEIEDLADTLNYATEEIGKTEQLRRDFLANVSHDLRTPLTMVKAYAEMIRDISGSDECKRKRHSQVIVDEADRLTLLVNDILNLSKLESGTEQLAFEEVDIAALSKIVVERFDVYATRDGYKFEIDTDGDCKAYCDPKRLEQVLYNLVGNAVNYSGESKRIKVTVTGGEKVRVSVRDFGEGIAEEDIPGVWERYYRASQNKRGIVGSGLGLSIVKNILDAHGVEYGVSSKLGEGTEFWFYLVRPSENGEEPPVIQE